MIKKPNGCGAGCRFLRVPQFIFKASCDKHDEYYITGGGIVEFVMANAFFFSYMLEDISSCNYRFPKRQFYFLIAIIYFIGVSIFGIPLFNWHNRLKLSSKSINK